MICYEIDYNWTKAGTYKLVAINQDMDTFSVLIENVPTTYKLTTIKRKFWGFTENCA